MLKMDAVIARLTTRGWTKGIMIDSEGKCCLFGAISVAERGNGLWSSMLPFETYAKVLEPIIQEQFPGRVVKGGDPISEVVAFNNHPATTFDDVVMVCEKAAAKEGI